MKIKEYSKLQINLDYEGIDTFSEWLSENLKGIVTEQITCTKARLVLEEVLLRLHDNFSEETQVNIELLGSMTGPYIRLEIPGESFNPLSYVNDEMGEWNSSLQTAVGMNPKYTYSWGKNILRLKIPKKKINPVLLIFTALIIGAVLGLLGHFVLPATALVKFTNYFLDPAYELWLKTLYAISGPIIFFTVITTMLNTRTIDNQGGNSTHTVLRYFCLSFLINAVALQIAYPFFYGEVIFKVNGTTVEKTMEFIKDIIPENIVAPFLDANTPQLILVAFVLGAALIVLGERVTQVKTILRQVNMVGLKVAQWVSMLVPIFAGIFIGMEIIKGKTATLRGIYMPILLSVLASLAMMLGAVIFVSISLRVSPLLFGRKVQKPFLIALRTGSLDLSMEHTRHSCTHLLGIDKTYTGISLPQGLVLYMPVSAIGTLIFTIYAAKVYHVNVDIFWFICAIIFAVILFVATPPVPGANLLAYVVFFNWLGIPGEALMDAMIFDIVFGILAGAGNQLLLQVELVLQAKKYGILDREKLIKPLVPNKKAKAKSGK